jgi:hypothetical protein
VTGGKQRVPWRVVAAAFALVMAAAACNTASTTDVGVPLVPTTRKPPEPVWQRVVAPDGRAGDHFGGALWYDTFNSPVRARYYATPGQIALSADGRVRAVGAPGHSHDGDGKGAGSVYVFDAAAGDDAAPVEVRPAAPGAADGFGWSLALSGDGNTLFVGAPFHDNGSLVDAGQVYVFRRSASGWEHITTIVANAPAAYDEFGWSVAVSRDGTTALIGTPGRVNGKAEHAGAAYVVAPKGSTWSITRELRPARAGTEANFGSFVALSADGTTAAVTASTHLDGQGEYRHGALYVFETDDAWTTASTRATFAAPNRNRDGTSDQFGVDLELSDDGSVVAVAAPDVNIGEAFGAGAVYVYDVADGAKPTLARSLFPTEPADYGYYGSSVALSADGRTLLVGVDNVGANGQGAIELLDATGSQADPWTEAPARRTITAPRDDVARLGTSVAMSADARTLFTTAPWSPVASNRRQGDAWIVALHG